MEQSKTLGQSSLYNDQVSLYIEGVKCSKCIQKLETLPLRRGMENVLSSRYDQGSAVLKLEVRTNSESSSLQSWVSEIQSLGFKATPVFTNNEIEEKQKLENRNWLLRLGITFFIAGNIMIFSASIYTGAVNEWKSFFAFLSGILFLPILTYSATPFFKQALQSLKDHTFSADVAIAIALSWGALLSYVNLFRGNDNFYFDSTASFIFLILLSRYALLRMQNRFHSDLHPDTLFSSDPFYKNDRTSSTHQLHFKDLKASDRFTIKADQVVPTHCLLLSECTEVDTSMYNGESLPKLFKRGETLKAGMTNISQEIQVQAICPFAESELALLFNKIMQGKSEKTRAIVKAEKSTSLLLGVVSALTLLVLAYFGWHQQWNTGFQRALALFTIACPCALSFAIPLASFTAMKRSLEQGLFVKSPTFFEKINEIKKIYFDKTGTLTEGVLSFSNWLPSEPSKEIQAVIYSLEAESTHPLAKSICKHLKSSLEPSFQTALPVALPVENRSETPGSGISGIINGITYEIRALVNPTSSAAGFSLYKNSAFVTSALFTDHIKKDTQNVLSYLKKLNFSIGVLSGDHEQSVAKTTQALGIDKDLCFSSLNPEEKALKVTEEKSLMVGDGHNDALALSKAYVSIAVNGSAWTSLSAADSYASTGGVDALPLAFKMSQFYRRLIKQNITLSLTYNIAAGLAAILGFINPLTAAVLMPINSIIVISFTALAQPKLTKNKANGVS
jgi:Cu2+-exporting ATPase/Cu+-exporting ATPase